jgi:hypothetical protein
MIKRKYQENLKIKKSRDLCSMTIMTKTKPELRQQKLIISPEVKKGAHAE